MTEPSFWVRSLWFSGSFWSAGGSSGAVVALVEVDGEFADGFAGGVVDDAHVEGIDAHRDPSSVKNWHDSDVVELNVDSQADMSPVAVPTMR